MKMQDLEMTDQIAEYFVFTVTSKYFKVKS